MDFIKLKTKGTLTSVRLRKSLRIGILYSSIIGDGLVSYETYLVKFPNAELGQNG